MAVIELVLEPVRPKKKRAAAADAPAQKPVAKKAEPAEPETDLVEVPLDGATPAEEPDEAPEKD
jgi:hypothetical protein